MRNWGNSFSNPNVLSREDKMSIISSTMYSNQPTFRDFRKCDGFSNEEIQKDEKELRKKMNTISHKDRAPSDDMFAESMEPVLAYILNDQRLLPSRDDNYSFMASEYDDKCKGTDIVFGVMNRNKDGHLVFAVDVATGTRRENIMEKFNNSYDKYNGVTDLHYCMHDDRKWKEPMAPHFVLGMSPASQANALDKFVFEGNELKGREKDTERDFIVLSELCEQIYLHLAMVRTSSELSELKEEKTKKLKDFLMAVNAGLYRILGITSKEFPDSKNRENVFNERYQSMGKNLQRKDVVYANILAETWKRRHATMAKVATRK
ncbi:hypothetical protein IKD49_03050 [Candidatus Saccharibacteria bacterium]|nr:hypothetical protein [Candidatus Saccharibacteria bacterium]